MGSGSSKVAKNFAGAAQSVPKASRQYPQRVPPNRPANEAPAVRPQGSNVHPEAQASVGQISEGRSDSTLLTTDVANISLTTF